MKHTRIFLIGFMGAGKSAVGRVVARRLRWRFIDLDEEVKRRAGLDIPTIFREGGEAHFRDLERLCLKDAAKTPNAVIALGGGTFIDPENRSIAEKSGVTVWLKVSFPNAVSRVRMNGTRPLFTDRDEAEKLYRRREGQYALAKIHVPTDERDIQSVADEILGVVRRL